MLDKYNDLKFTCMNCGKEHYLRDIINMNIDNGCSIDMDHLRSSLNKGVLSLKFSNTKCDCGMNFEVIIGQGSVCISVGDVPILNSKFSPSMIGRPCTD